MRLPRRRWCVYRLYSASGHLLYIGKSWWPEGFDRRLDAHQKRSWGPWIVRWDIDRYWTEQGALDAETDAIGRERPLFNRAGNGQRGEAAERVLARRLASKAARPSRQ